MNYQNVKQHLGDRKQMFWEYILQEMKIEIIKIIDSKIEWNFWRHQPIRTKQRKKRKEKLQDQINKSRRMRSTRKECALVVWEPSSSSWKGLFHILRAYNSSSNSLILCVCMCGTHIESRSLPLVSYILSPLCLHIEYTILFFSVVCPSSFQ